MLCTLRTGYHVSRQTRRGGRRRSPHALHAAPTSARSLDAAARRGLGCTALRLPGSDLLQGLLQRGDDPRKPRPLGVVVRPARPQQAPQVLHGRRILTTRTHAPDSRMNGAPAMHDRLSK